MATPDQDHTPDLTTNRLLAALPASELDALRPHLTIIDLAIGETIHAPHTPIHVVYFPLTGCASVVATDEEGDILEVGTIGREGMVGLTAFHEADGGPLETIGQVPGDYARLPVAALHAAAAPGCTLHRLLHRYSHAAHLLTAQSAACNRFHDMEARCARWLLLTQDRVGREVFPLTHEFLGYMLGTRRAGVTIAMGVLQHAGLITYYRGEVTILDRDGLENGTCECYRVITAEYDRLIGQYPYRKQDAPDQ
ncbi:MAG TPA: Crp/Fnr family transcriptional regulator [Thermomicrobiales bacterium]